MDVRSMTVAGVKKSATVDEDPAEYFHSHEDVGEWLDPLVDGAEAEEATKAKQKELREFGVYETVDLHVASYNTLGSGPQKKQIRAHFVAREFQSDETMYDVFAHGSHRLES